MKSKSGLTLSMQSDIDASDGASTRQPLQPDPSEKSRKRKAPDIATMSTEELLLYTHSKCATKEEKRQSKFAENRRRLADYEKMQQRLASCERKLAVLSADNSSEVKKKLASISKEKEALERKLRIQCDVVFEWIMDPTGKPSEWNTSAMVAELASFIQTSMKAIDRDGLADPS